MPWLKKNLLFTIVMVVLAIVLAVELFFVLGRRQVAQRAESEFQGKVEEYRRLLQKPVLPHENNIALTQAEIDRQREELQLYHTLLRGESEFHQQFARHPRTRSDAFFDIASFVDEYRQRANAANVAVPENEYFGFGAYSTAGPDERQIPAVYKQRLIVAHILDVLFEAQPETLVAIQRPGGEGAAAAPADASGRRGAAGEPQQAPAGAFRLDSQFSAAVPNVADALPFQVVFTGRSGTLRRFLNDLSTFDIPLLVRTVEVTPASETPDQGQTGGARRRTPAREARTEGTEENAQRPDVVPIVRDNLSRFTVALEFVDVRPLENSRR
jgi:hypothetical protein